MAILIEPPEKKPELTGSVIIKDTVVFSSYEDYVLSPKNAETLYFISASPDVTEINFLQKLIIATNTGNIDFIVAKAFLGSTKIYDQLDYPTLDLNFALTKSLDPRITFTRASSGTYFDSNGVLQTATVNTPRFDHNPNTKESLGLLIEEQRTNLLLYSEQFDNAYWIKTNATITANTIVAPDGTLTGDKCIETTASGVHIVGRYLLTVPSAATITYSVYAKAAERTQVGFICGDGSTNPVIVFNLLTGAVISSGAGITASSIAPVGNGWYRCTATRTVAGTTADMQIRTAVGGNTGYVGDGYSGIYIWGAQLEAGAFATSVIRTTGTAATRAADVATMTGTNFSGWYNQSQGVVLGEYRYLSTGVANQYALSINNNSANESINIVTSTPNRERVVMTTGGITQADFESFNFSAGQLVKRAIAIASNNAATVANGGIAATDNTFTPPSPNQLSIGSANYIPNSQINGRIKRIAYFNRRLANSELQLLTT